MANKKTAAEDINLWHPFGLFSMSRYILLVPAAWLVWNGHFQLPICNKRHQVFPGKKSQITVSEMLTNLSLATFNGTESKNSGRNILVTDLVTNLVTDQVSLCTWTNFFRCNVTQRNNGLKHIALNKLRSSAGIQFCVFIGVPHTGTKFICEGNLPEYF